MHKPHRYKTNSGEAFRNTILHFFTQSLSRSDDNRRADGGHLDLQQYIISYLLKIISTTADVCEAIFEFFVYFVD